MLGWSDGVKEDELYHEGFLLYLLDYLQACVVFHRYHLLETDSLMDHLQGRLVYSYHTYLHFASGIDLHLK